MHGFRPQREFTPAISAPLEKVRKRVLIDKANKFACESIRDEAFEENVLQLYKASTLVSRI